MGTPRTAESSEEKGAGSSYKPDTGRGQDVARIVPASQYCEGRG